MYRDHAGKFESGERMPTEKEKQWKMNEEKQKAKQNERAKRLAFARPISATESWKTRAGQNGGDKRRPHSARMGGDSAKITGASAGVSEWQLPSEGEGDGAKVPGAEGDGAKVPGAEERRVDEVAEESEEVDDDVEDVLIADYELVTPRTKSPDLQAETISPDESLDLSLDRGQTNLSTEDAPIDTALEDQRAHGTVFTPLTPFDFKEEEEEHCSTDKEESITVIPTDTPTLDGKLDDGESSQVDDDEDENGVDATIEAEKSERHETERDDQFAERQAEEHLATMRGHSEEFVLTPIPQTLTRAYRCRVSRREAGCFDLYAERPCGERAFLMTAKKKKAAATTTYTIFSGGENGGEPNGQGRNAIEIGGMKANLLGTNFTVFRRQRKGDKGHPPGISYELAVITYEPNILGLKGPRRIGVVVPGMTTDGSRVMLKSKDPNDSIVARMKSNASSHLIRMENKTPTWNEDSQSFVLNFSGRVTKASIKNFQIVHADDPDYIVFQFGRISETEFTLDLRYPLCPLQAFGCALSSMNRKLACE